MSGRQCETVCETVCVCVSAVFDLRLEAIVREDEETGARLLVLRAADEEQEGVQFCTVITGDLESTSESQPSCWPNLEMAPTMVCQITLGVRMTYNCVKVLELT